MKIVVFIILISHFFAARPFFSCLIKGRMPNTSHFATMSVILYYDIGLMLDLFGLPEESQYFTPLFQAKGEIFVQASILLLLLPWSFHLGSFITNKRKPPEQQNTVTSIIKSKRVFFYLFSTTISLYLAISGLLKFSQSESVWSARESITEDMGFWIIILYLPMHFLAFYVNQLDSKKFKGLLFSTFLALSNIVSTLIIGQRTNMLLPILVLVLFRKKITLNKIIIFVSIAVIASAALLPIFKWQYADGGNSLEQLVVETIHGDISRSSVLSATLESTEILGTQVMAYPMSGYVYSLLFFVPRNIVPFKGWPTGQYFTSHIVGTHVDDTGWSFGVGAMEEILLNIGLFWCIPVLILYGMCMGQLDKLSWRIPSLVIPTRLAAVWLCGYDLPALLLNFGTMSILGIIFNYVFAQKPKQTDARQLYGNSYFIKSH